MRIAGIGYQGRTIDELIVRLRSASVTAVFDVRELPWSRRAEFSKSGAASAEILARYRAHLAETPSVLDEILAETRGECVALLCYEADVKECHRSVLLEALAALRPGLVVDAL